MQSALGNFASNPTVAAQATAQTAHTGMQSSNSVFKTQQSKNLTIKDERKSLTKNKRKKSRATDEEFQFGIAFNLFPLVDPINLFAIQQFLQSRSLSMRMVTKIYQKFT